MRCKTITPNNGLNTRTCVNYSQIQLNHEYEYEYEYGHMHDAKRFAHDKFNEVLSRGQQLGKNVANHQRGVAHFAPYH